MRGDEGLDRAAAAGRRRRARAAAAVAALAWLLAACARRERPDVLLLTLDTVRADHLAPCGDERVRMPAIEALARSGTTFARAMTAVPLTLPSHCTLLTGTYPPYHRVRENGDVALDPSFDTLAEILADAGYETAAFVSSFSLNHVYGIGQGFAVYDDVAATNDLVVAVPGRDAQRMLYPERPARETVDRALAWLARPTRRPRFLWVHLFDAHDPYAPTPPFDSLYRGDPYRGEIASIDPEIARLLDAFDPRRPPVVALVADHGEALGGHGEATHGLLLYEETIRVPMILAAPGAFTGGGIRDDLAETVDVLPTLLAAAGIRWSGPLQGRDLALAEPDSLGYAETLYGKLAYGWSDLRAARSGDWKLIAGSDRELFDLAGDPGETRPAGAAPPAIAGRLAARVDSVVAAKTDLPESASVVHATREETEALAALGYIGSARMGRGASSDLDAERGSGIDPRRGVRWVVALDAVDSLIDAGRADSAVALCRAAAASPEAGVPLVVSSAGKLTLARERAGARAVLETLAASWPGDPHVLTNLGVTCLDMNDGPAARRAFEAALAIDAQNAPALYNLGGLLVREGKADSAIAPLRESIRIDPANVPATILLARLLADRQYVEEAHRLAREALAREPANGEAAALRDRLERAYPELSQGAGGPPR